MKPVIIIPAYKPEQALLTLINSLAGSDQRVIVINDGSGEKYDPVFAAVEKYDFVTVLKHAINLGKGQALKTGFHYFLMHFADHPGVITADADGQHSPVDIIRLSKELEYSPHELWLGARTFENDTIPWRSRFGNQLTRTLFRLLIGQSLQDTQTGLRGIPRSFLSQLLKTNSVGYDFELDMLVLAAKQKIPLRELPIETIYQNNNQSSHFNPLIDSFKIYFVFIRFLIFAIVSGLLDFFAFSIAFMLCSNIFLSEGLARAFSGTCNFLLNKELVFQSKQNMLPEAIKYILLCCANLVFSYTLISSLSFIGLNVYASKMIALVGLFFANFAIQKLFVFGRESALSS